jgi:hypothetical protein
MDPILSQINPVHTVSSCFFDIYFSTGKGKGKAIPLQALTGPEGSKRLRLPDFKKIGT